MLALYVLRMRNNNLKIMNAGSSCRPAITLRPVSRFSFKTNMHCATHASGETREKRVAKKRENREHVRSLALYLIVEVAVE